MILRIRQYVLALTVGLVEFWPVPCLLVKTFERTKNPCFSGVFALLLLSMSVVWVFTNKDKNLEAKLAIETPFRETTGTKYSL